MIDNTNENIPEGFEDTAPSNTNVEEVNIDGKAIAKTYADPHNPGLDQVGNRAESGVENATREGDLQSGPNPNHDIDPYMNQSNANHGRHVDHNMPSYDEEQKRTDVEIAKRVLEESKAKLNQAETAITDDRVVEQPNTIPASENGEGK